MTRHFLLSLAALASLTMPAVAETRQQNDFPTGDRTYVVAPSSKPANPTNSTAALNPPCSAPSYLMKQDGRLINGLLPNPPSYG